MSIWTSSYPGTEVFLRGSFSDLHHLEWVRDGNNTFLVPAKKQSKINCFHRWEQSFHIYATIYCGKHPSRAREIWQYISVINTAASSFVWSNVYNYDIIFHQLMQFKPLQKLGYYTWSYVKSIDEGSIAEQRT